MQSNTAAQISTIAAKPILKWAGGKTQMLGELLPKVPSSYGRYIEPFFGGGALFFALQPENAVIADSNPELINMYRQVADHVDDVISYLEKYQNTSEMFYSVRSLDWETLPKAEAAARTIYLNRTCYNGLYRVNKKGQFNVPYGKYKNPKICDTEALHAASQALRKADIVCGDYFLVLEHYAQPLVHELYAPFKIDVIQTKRHISCNGSTRKGEDVIVTVPPKQHFLIKLAPKPLPEQVSAYPPTRFMGSKSKLLSEIWSVASQFQAETVVDLFSGSGIVGYMFKAQGKTVISNDYMSMSATFTKAMLENNNVTLPLNEAKSLLVTHKESDHFVASTFKDLYYTDDENDLIDTLRTNIAGIHDQYKRAIAMTALIRACTKKRPRGIFTYTGNRYNDGRKDLQKALSQQFLEAVDAVNKAVFDNGKPNKSRNGDAMDLRIEQADLVYIDPPYYSPLSDNEYVRRYHFVEGLARDWKGVEIQEHTQTKKFKSYPTPFSTRKGAADAFDRLFKKFANSVLIVSYSSNSLPTQDEMVAIMAKYKKHVEVVPVDYKYSFGNQSDAKTHRNSVQEYLFVGY